MASNRASSAAWSSGRRSRCNRFFTDFPSGTRRNRMSAATPSSGLPCGGSSTTSSGSDAVMRQPNASAHHWARAGGSLASTASAWTRIVMRRCSRCTPDDRQGSRATNNVTKAHRRRGGPSIASGGDGVDLPRPDRARDRLRHRRADRQPPARPALDRGAVGAAGRPSDRAPTSGPGGTRTRSRGAGGGRPAGPPPRSDGPGPISLRRRIRRRPRPPRHHRRDVGRTRRGAVARRRRGRRDHRPARRAAGGRQEQGDHRAGAAPRRPARRDAGPARRR